MRSQAVIGLPSHFIITKGGLPGSEQMIFPKFQRKKDRFIRRHRKSFVPQGA
jgi:hypothetical protein